MSIVEVISPDYIKVMSGVGIGVVATLAVTWVRQVDIAHAQRRINAFVRSEDDQDARFLAEHKRRFASAPTDPDVTGELVAVEETGLTFVVGENGPVLALSDLPHHDDTDRPHWWASVVAFVVLAPLAFARRQLPVLVEWLSYRFKSQAQRDAEFVDSGVRALEQARDEAKPLRSPFEIGLPDGCDPEPVNVDDPDEVMVELAAWKAANPPSNPWYTGRHWASDVQHTAIFPTINPSIPAPREGDADA